MYAFVYRSGVIKVAQRRPRDATAVPLARGPRRVLNIAIERLTQRVNGAFMVPGVMNAGDAEALRAVEAFRARLDKLLPPENCSRFLLAAEGV